MTSLCFFLFFVVVVVFVEEVEEKTVLGLILSHPSTVQVPLGTG